MSSLRTRLAVPLALAIVGTHSASHAQGLDDLFDDLMEDAVPIADETNDDAFLDDDGLDALLGGTDFAESAANPGVLDSVDALRSWKGYLAFQPRVYFRDRNRGFNDEQLVFEGELELDFRLGENTSAYYRPRIFLDALDNELQRFEPFEAYVTYATDRWDVRAGQFVENWGIVDTFNPIDVINRRDFGTDALDADRLGELGFRYRRFFDGGQRIGEPTVSLYALPVFRETPFPPERQRFGFGSGFQGGSAFEPDGFEEALVALRYQSTLQTPFADADIQAVIARGPERVPTFSSSSGDALSPAYFGVTTLGAGFRAVPNEEVAGDFLSSLTLKAEVVHKAPYTFDDSPVDAPDDYLTTVVGVDRGFFGVTNELDQLTLTLEYAHERGANDPSALLRPFRDDFILRAFWEANDFARQSLELRGIFDTRVSETVCELIYERQLRSIHPDLQLTLELRTFDPAAQGESFFSLFPDNSSFAFGLRWDF